MIVRGVGVDNKHFESLYRDATIRARVRKLAHRYFRSYGDLLSTIGYYDAEEIEQELWARAVESRCTSSKLLFQEMVNDINDMVRTAKRQRRAEYVDIMAYALEDDDGNQESEEEAMSRLVYEGGASKIG